MEDTNYLSLIADLLAIISLLLAMYFYYASRTKEIEELKKIVENKSKEEMENLSKELLEIKKDIKHLNDETFDLVKKQVSFMQQQVGQVGTKSTTKPDVEILNTIMQHKVITIETFPNSISGVNERCAKLSAPTMLASSNILLYDNAT